MQTIFYLKTLTIFFLMLTVSNSTRKLSPYPNDDLFTMPSDLAQDTPWNISAKMGSTFTIKIRGNPTTGYSWFLENRTNLNTSLIQALNLSEHGSADYVTDPSEPGMVGVGGYYYFRFSALAAGDAQLVFVHKRPWETSPLKTVTVNVSIK
jgi:predicted secreted protein